MMLVLLHVMLVPGFADQHSQSEAPCSQPSAGCHCTEHQYLCPFDMSCAEKLSWAVVEMS